MFKLHTGYELFSDSQGFLLEENAWRGPGNLTPRRIVTALTIEQVDAGAYVKPSFTLGQHEVQELFNQLWQQGYRPKDGTGNGGHVEAIKYHLEDMRKLVFSVSGSPSKGSDHGA